MGDSSRDREYFQLSFISAGSLSIVGVLAYDYGAVQVKEPQSLVEHN